jgi:hypothetical protein
MIVLFIFWSSIILFFYILKGNIQISICTLSFCFAKQNFSETHLALYLLRAFNNILLIIQVLNHLLKVISLQILILKYLLDILYISETRCLCFETVLKYIVYSFFQRLLILMILIIIVKK